MNPLCVNLFLRHPSVQTVLDALARQTECTGVAECHEPWDDLLAPPQDVLLTPDALVLAGLVVVPLLAAWVLRPFRGRVTNAEKD